MKKLLIIIAVLVIIYFSLIYFSDNLDRFLKFLGKAHAKLVQWLEENVFPKIKEEFRKEKQEIGQSLKELFSKVFLGLFNFVKDIF